MENLERFLFLIFKDLAQRIIHWDRRFDFSQCLTMDAYDWTGKPVFEHQIIYLG